MSGDGSLGKILVGGSLLWVALTGCGGLKSALHTNGSDTPQSRAPNLDFNLAELSPNGCLDLSLLAQRFNYLPDGAVVREYTREFKMSDKTPDGKDLPRARYRNMVAETSFANLRFSDTPSAAFAATLPSTVQDTCANVDMTDELGANVHYSVVHEDDPSLVHLKSDDGLHETTFHLTSPRTLEITTSAPRIDRCPAFMRAEATTTVERSWGLSTDLQNQAPQIAVDYLRNVAIAVRNVPSGISSALENATGDSLALSADDLTGLKNSTLNPLVVQCPFDSTPPSADEPPPDPNQPTPGPTPAPSASPAPTPAPTATPNPSFFHGW